MMLVGVAPSATFAQPRSKGLIAGPERPSPAAARSAGEALAPPNDDCDDANIRTYDECIGTVCTNTPSLYGDVDDNGVRNVFDIFCILDRIAGQFDRCRFRDMDLEPCTGNGTLNVFDIFAVLDVIAGTDPCCS